MEKFLKDELLALLEKARAGNASEEDYSRIAAIINADQAGDLITLADNFLAQEKPLSSKHIEPYDHEYWQQAFREIKDAWQQQNAQPAKLRRMRSWWVAASIIVLLSIGTYFLVKTRSAPKIAGTTEILPGKDGANLTLADGSQILLDNIKNGVVARQGGTTAKVVNGTLIYEGNGSEIVYNVMSTPKARQFHIILPDGTKAWLNSASSIRYPTTFTGKERSVTVTGEVYFEVAKNTKMPFRLNVNNQAQIEVLGTHFNVKAYENESVINTTLFEGSIAITASRDKLILKPGQQAQILVGQKKQQVRSDGPKEAVTVIDNTDVEKVMAWKNRVFDFNDIAFDDAMYQLERWYDINVVYEKGIPDIELSGKISKDVTLNDMVTILEKIGVKCRLEERKLLIQL